MSSHWVAPWVNVLPLYLLMSQSTLYCLWMGSPWHDSMTLSSDSVRHCRTWTGA